MRRATTPTHSFGLPEGLAVSDIKYIRVTYAQDKKTIVEKTEDDTTISEGRLYVRLEQTDTVKFSVGDIEMQLRIVTNNGDSIQSKLFKVPCERVLNDEVLV